MDDASAPFRARPRLGLFLVSVGGLFLELLLIRWLGTEIRLLAYLQNVILVVCFLGLGLGCFATRGRTIDLGFTTVPLATLAALMAFPPTARSLHGLADLAVLLVGPVGWTMDYEGHLGQALFGVVLTCAWLLLVMFAVGLAFVPLGQLLGRYLDEDRDVLVAYSINVAGSLVGVWGFALLSYVGVPPAGWMAAAWLVLSPFLLYPIRGWLLRGLAAVALVPLAGLASLDPGAITTVWSPYQKLSVHEVPREGDSQVVKWVKVNGAGYQQMIDLRPATTDRAPSVYPPEQSGLTEYDIPSLLHDRPARVLIAGAGSGNDAAGALRNGATEVVAIEIDPAIITLGRQMHPERPYDDPRVRVVNDDARGFFARSDERFDLIVFGLLDSHTTNAMANARLDHYVYTRESLRLARRLLADDGLMVLTFEARKAYIGDRFARTLEEEFGAAPLAVRVPANTYQFGGLMFVAGNTRMAQARIDGNPRLAKLIAQWQADEPLSFPHTTPVATDDWPYIYLETPRIPSLFLVLAALLAAVTHALRRFVEVPPLVSRWERSHTHFALLGAAFLLLETQNISKASVVLGNTWLVSAVILSGVLGMVLVANAVAAAFPRLPTVAVGALLCATCLGLYALDLAVFAALPFAARAATVGVVSTLPMALSGVLFIRSFRDTARKDEALGANLAGSLAGALVQPITYLVGVKALLLVVAALYAGALLTRPRPLT